MSIYKAGYDPRNHPYGGALHHSDTGYHAAQQIEPLKGDLQWRVMRYFEWWGESTCDDAEVVTKLPHQTCSARIRELVQSGHLEDSGARKRTRSGRSAIVWRMVK